MEYSRELLSGGFGFNTIHSEKFKTETVAVMFNSPLNEENASYTALLLNVLMRGCRKYPTIRDLSKQLDELYDTSISTFCFKRGENHVSGFILSYLKNEFAFSDMDIGGCALAVLTDILTDPLIENDGFSAFYVEREAENLINGIKAKKNDKISYAPSRCVKIMCDAEPYSADECGSRDIISKITPSALYKFYKEEFVKFGCEVFHLGEEPSCVKVFTERLCNSFASAERYKITDSSVHVTNEVKRVCETESVSQAKLCLGLNTNKRLSDGDYYNFTVFAEIFANSPSSRLFKNVREKLSLCYYCRCVADHHKGIAIVSLGIDAENTTAAEKEIMHQIDQLACGEISDDELELAKLTIYSAYREVYDTQSGLINWYYNRLCAGGKALLISPLDNFENIKKVTVADIAKCASGIKLDTVYLMKGGENDE